MQLLVVRHAIAVDPDAATNDALRELTPEGRKKMQRAANGLREAVPRLDLLAASPLVRAQQTTEILAAVYEDMEVTTIDELVPTEPPAALGRWLARQQHHELIALVGHEPHLSAVVSWLLTGDDRNLMHFGKGGACLLEFPDEVGPGRATLHWFMRSGHLRALAQ